MPSYSLSSKFKKQRFSKSKISARKVKLVPTFTVHKLYRLVLYLQSVAAVLSPPTMNLLRRNNSYSNYLWLTLIFRSVLSLWNNYSFRIPCPKVRSIKSLLHLQKLCRSMWCYLNNICNSKARLNVCSSAVQHYRNQHLEYHTTIDIQLSTCTAQLQELQEIQAKYDKLAAQVSNEDPLIQDLTAREDLPLF
jgi:hypothetical protein